MNTHRVKGYKVEFTKGSETIIRSELFNESHAREADTVLEPDGLSITAARRLIDKWNRIGEGLHKYSIPFVKTESEQLFPKLIGEFDHPKHGKYYLWHNPEPTLYGVSKVLTIPVHCGYKSISECLKVKGL